MNKSKFQKYLYADGKLIADNKIDNNNNDKKMKKRKKPDSCDDLSKEDVSNIPDKHTKRMKPDSCDDLSKEDVSNIPDKHTKRRKHDKTGINKNNNNDSWKDFHFTKDDVDNLNKIIDEYEDRISGLWVSASKTKYFLLGDTCLDWLMLYYNVHGIESVPLTNDKKLYHDSLLKDASHLELLFEGGNIFEQKVYEELAQIYNEDFQLVFTKSDYDTFAQNRDMNGFIRSKYNETIELMKKGTPIIAQAVMINDSNMTYGIADILIRSDYLNVVYFYFESDPDIKKMAPKLEYKSDNTYHYRVIDCKWTTMTLCVDQVTVRNEGLFPAYKGQLAVYTSCLEQMQGYTPNYAYIMSKAWKIGKTNIPIGDEYQYRGFSGFDRLGVINYTGKDKKYLKLTKDAIKWIHRVNTEGNEWRYHKDKPSVPEMYPNINKNFNPMFADVKKILADRYGDPTQIWYVDDKNRKIARSNGIININDERCNVDTLGITSKIRRSTIQKILDVNRTTKKADCCRPNKIINNDYNWQNPYYLDYYIDFETICYNLYVRPQDMDIDNSYVDSDVTFMIGIGYEKDDTIDSERILQSLEIDTGCNYYHCVDGRWEYVCLYFASFVINNELELFRVFFQFIIVRQELMHAEKNMKEKTNSRLFHWTSAELRFLKRAQERIISGLCTKESWEYQMMLNHLTDRFNSDMIWIDMCAIFQSEPIVIKGSYRFKLKHIANAFYNNGLIKTKWRDGQMSDGFKTMLEAIKLYREGSTTKSKKFTEIIEYNEVDCKVIWEIVDYLRKYHSSINNI